jgi:hypothetical protein
VRDAQVHASSFVRDAAVDHDEEDVQLHVLASPSSNTAWRHLSGDIAS